MQALNLVFSWVARLGRFDLIKGVPAQCFNSAGQENNIVGLKLKVCYLLSRQLFSIARTYLLLCKLTFVNTETNRTDALHQGNLSRQP